MEKSPLKGKGILAVDDEPDVLEVLEDNLAGYGVKLDPATSYEEGREKIMSLTYDLVVLDIMGVRGFDLLQLAVAKNLPVVMLTAHAATPNAIKKSIELGARAYLLKDELADVAPFLENVLELDYKTVWKRNLEKVGGAFGKKFGPEWRVSEKEFWKKLENDLELEGSVIITQ
jgi:DNA-binding NtrC family response regulator